MASSPSSVAASAGYDRLAELKAFDDTKVGVKGLVDAGVTTIPRIFHHPPDPHHSDDVHHATYSIPVIDLLAAGATRAELVAQVEAAAETAGFFQVVNHGVPEATVSEMLAAVRRFHEQPAEEKRPYYTRDMAMRVRYSSNYDLFQSPAASWRDTLYLELTPGGPSPEEIPPACRDIVLEYTRQVRSACGALLELLSEAMGVHPEYLERDAGCLEGMSVSAHYYPPCPEPHLTMGTARHSDTTFLTVLLQDGVGGLQALIVNVGAFLQVVSNDAFQSVDHRVVATAAGPRVSVACFFRPGGVAASTTVYGPVVREEGGAPPRYRSFTVAEFLDSYQDMGFDGRPALDHFKL